MLKKNKRHKKNIEDSKNSNDEILVLKAQMMKPIFSKILKTTNDENPSIKTAEPKGSVNDTQENKDTKNKEDSKNTNDEIGF